MKMPRDQKTNQITSSIILSGILSREDVDLCNIEDYISSAIETAWGIEDRLNEMEVDCWSDKNGYTKEKKK